MYIYNKAWSFSKHVKYEPRIVINQHTEQPKGALVQILHSKQIHRLHSLLIYLLGWQIVISRARHLSLACQLVCFVSTVMFTRLDLSLWPLNPLSMGNMCTKSDQNALNHFYHKRDLHVISVSVNWYLDLLPLTSKSNRVLPLVIVNYMVIISAKFENNAHNSLISTLLKKSKCHTWMHRLMGSQSVNI